ncbi:MAG: nitrogenase [Scytonema sp. RU_4_4]|nr:nitrogenase [Scytonema sp. RU_4_4]NJR75478.1 nitrogenase [Scytonema sp. CRU_2_7]
MTNFTHIHRRIALFSPIREWLDQVDIHNSKVANWICQLIPSQCPFARDIKLWGERVVLHIPPLCKLNPFYEELMGLRFRALSYLADECNQDITSYI